MSGGLVALAIFAALFAELDFQRINAWFGRLYSDLRFALLQRRIRRLMRAARH